MIFEPQNGMIVLKAAHQGGERKTEGGLLIPEPPKGSENTRFKEAEVLAIDSFIFKHNKGAADIGDIVMYNGFNEVTTDKEGIKCHVIKYDLVDGIVRRKA